MTRPELPQLVIKIKDVFLLAPLYKYGFRRTKLKNVSVFIAFFVIVCVVYHLAARDWNSPYLVETEYEDRRSRLKKYFSKNLFKGYACEQDQCVKRYGSKNKSLLTLETCNMLCSTPSLWPQPQHFQIFTRNAANFDPNYINITIFTPKELEADITDISLLFLRKLPVPQHDWSKQNLVNVRLNIKVQDKRRKPTLSMSERYTLKVLKTHHDVQITVEAPTYIGAIYALETLTQLIWLEDTLDLVALKILHDVVVEDYPIFPHRGLMIDTARHFFPIKQLKGLVDGMVASKLNVLHLHLTDAVSFPIVLPSYPEMAKYGAYGPSKIYTPRAIKELIEYSRLRGVRVVLEIDAPSHVNEGWNHVEPKAENLVICNENDPLSGHLNPDNPDTLEILQNIYRDLLDLGTDENYFHIGNDEVDIFCYQGTKAASAYDDVMKLWGNFTDAMIDRLHRANGYHLPENIAIWSSPLTDALLLKKYKKFIVVQFWLGNFHSLITEGYKIVISTVGNWYLDCGLAPWRPADYQSSCNPYSSWQTFYQYRPWNSYLAYRKQILGGEACLWSEVIDTNTLESKVWPRAAAMAERLWFDPDFYDSNDVFQRLSSHRERLVSRGIKNEPIWPDWCVQNPGKC